MMDFSQISGEEAINLSPEDFAAWLAYEEPDPPPPSAYPLGSNEGRCGFLEAYIWRGEVALVEAVNHAWNSLSEPRALKCVFIGMYAGSGGSGKWALAKMLRRALRESLDYDVIPPWTQPFADIHVLHAAATDYFAADFAHYKKTVQKYADILDGEPGRHAPPPSAQVIVGPWTALSPLQAEQSDRGK